MSSHYKPQPVKVPAQPADSDAPGLHLSVRTAVLVGLIVALVALFLLRLAVGSVSIPVMDIVRILTGGEGSRATWTRIVLDFRLPHALTAVLAGAALGVGGLMMQTLFRNPLAGPFVLGISSGASLGVALVVLTAGTAASATTGTLLAGISLGSNLSIAGAAITGAAATMLVVVLVARYISSSMTLLILGLMFGYFTSAMVSLLMYFSIPEQIQAYVSWTFGSFNGVTWREMHILAPVIVAGLVLAFALSKSLNALLLGEAYARSMGLHVQRARLGIVLATALLAGVVTAFCGPIGFIGIAVPHLCRSLFHTSDHRVLVPTTILMGGIVALAAALIAQAPGSQIILPLNAVTSLIGAPVVIWVILRQRNLQKSFAD